LDSFAVYNESTFHTNPKTISIYIIVSFYILICLFLSLYFAWRSSFCCSHFAILKVAMASSSSMAKSFALLALTFAGPVFAAPVAAPQAGGNDGQYNRPSNEGAYTWKPQATTNEGAYTWKPQPTSQIIGAPAEPTVNPDIPAPNNNQDPMVPGGKGTSTVSTGGSTATDTVAIPGGGPPPKPTPPTDNGPPEVTGGAADPATDASSAATAGATGTSSASSAEPSSGGGASGGAIQGKGKLYKGDGSVEKGWPGEKDWLSFESLWQNNQYALKSGCQPNDKGPVVQNKPKEIADIKTAIEEVSKESGIDNRYILAVVLQESNGCVRVKTTFSPGDNIPNPGLMQCHNGQFNCNDKGDKDCPTEQIKGMIKEGTEGTSKGDGLKQLMDKAKQKHKANEMAMQAYVAMRLYNSGENSLASSDDLSEGGATSSYASDIANRLTGHVF
jgi:hypothetical protein